jgi:hypothetical protein
MLPFLLKIAVRLILLCSIAHSAFSINPVVASVKDEPAWVQSWSALLHLHQGKPLIPDANFLLSLSSQTAEPFDTEREVQATIEAFTLRPELICRFPARWLLLNQTSPSLVANIQAPDCPDYQRFLEQAPAEVISVVFASENLTQSDEHARSWYVIAGRG